MRFTTRARSLLNIVALAACQSTGSSSQPPAAEAVRAALHAAARPLDLVDTAFSDLAFLERVLRGRDIVLLGENGHGVREFTLHKARLLRFLHERLGFQVVAFESPFHNCREADLLLDADSAVRAAQSCLLYQLQHTDLKPFFQYMVRTRSQRQPLHVAGVDFQVSLASARTRPRYLRSQLGAAQGERIAALDSALIEVSFQGTDSVRAWVRRNGSSTRAAFDSAAAGAAGALRWTLLTESALLDRLLTREGPSEVPVWYYESRDAWMARTIGWLADSAAAPRKVVAWMHNDHARYGAWRTPSGPARATGQFLRERYGDRVYSVALFMGRGQVADNSRRLRDMIAAPAGSLEDQLSRIGHRALFLAFDAHRAIRNWSNNTVQYLRAGLALDSLVLDREFDALLYVDSVSPPPYGIRN